MLILCAIVAALAAAYPRADRQSRSLSVQRASMVSVAYLEAWLLVEPDSPVFLESLAIQYLELGRWQAALEVAKRLSGVVGDDSSREKAFFLELVATEQMLYATPEQTPERAAKERRLATLLKDSTQLPWTVMAMRALAEKARTVGVDDVMVDFYQRLAAADTGNGARWHAKLGEVALATQAYDSAAFSYFSAYDMASGLDERRDYFIKALQVLESADRVAQACSEAETRLGMLADDQQTLRYLLTLARQANRGDLVTRYAKALLGTFPGAPVARDGYIMQVMADSTPRSEGYAARRALEDEYHLIYQAFIESRALDDAEETARMAMEAGLDAATWSARLAQAAQWNNHPDKALKYWLVHAQVTDQESAWDKVLELAPALDDDDSYLIAWSRLQRMRSRVAPEAAEGMKALASEYMEVRQWASMLRVIERLKSLEQGQAAQSTLLLEITVLEQHAYDFETGSARRAELMQRMHGLMEQAQALTWELPQTEWLAQKAWQTGAPLLAAQYYKRLVTQDAQGAANWQEKLGDLALSQQAYEEAAQAYFAAQDAADSRSEKIRYFQAALGAYVASGSVAQACEAGERRAGDLLDDPATLRYLINLARQAHRTDLMTRYARELIKVTQQSRSPAPYAEMARVNGLSHFGTAQVWQPERGLPTQHALYRYNDVVSRRFIADASSSTASSTQTDQRSADFDMAFRAFVESRQLNEAQQTAQQALDEGMDPLLWRPRLAQVAEWNTQPQTALRYWLLDARASGNIQAWTRVLTLSRQLNEVAAELAALKYMAARSPGDLDVLDDVVETYERLGQPLEGMAYLQGRAHGSLRVPMMERYARLAARSGHDAQARKAYESLQSFGPNPHEYAFGLASLEYAHGNLEQAIVILRNVRDDVSAAPATADYWRLYSELARLAQSNEDADFANRQLLATGRANDSDLNTLTYLYSRYPVDGGRIAETQFRKDGSPIALQSALSLYTAARAWQRIDALLNDLTPDQQGYFSRSSQLLAMRADYYAKIHRWDAALADLRAASQMDDVTDDVRILYLWTLLEFGNEDELRLAMHRWGPVAQVNPEYWGVFAAAEMRMGRPVRAVQYLRKQRLNLGDDPLWLMALADAEQSSGHVERAWSLRRQAWAALQKKLAERRAAGLDDQEGASGLFSPHAPSRHSFDAAGVSLSQDFANGDYSRALLASLLAREGRSPESRELARSILADTAGLPLLADTVPAATAGEQAEPLPGALGDTAREVVLAWALSGEHYDLARAWLARQYADHLLQPVDARMTLALQARDGGAAARLLADGRKNISTENRIDALELAGRHEEAQTQAYAAAQGAPESDTRHERMVEVLLKDRPAVGLNVVYADSDPLQYVQTSLTGGLKLTNRWGVGFEAINRNQRTDDSSVLAWVPAHDREIKLMLQHVTPDRKFTLTAGARDGLEGFYTASLRADLNRQGVFKTSLLFGLNQFTELSQALQVGGIKDLASVSVQWDPQSRWFMWGSAEVSRLRDQNRTYIGRGLELSADVGYRFIASYPDWSVRLTATRGIYSDSGKQIESLSRVLPTGASLAAADIVPRNFTQYGVMVGFGVNDDNAYWRRWRLFLDAGYVRDSNEGWGPLVNVGVGGSVFGGDHLRLYYLHAAARQGDGRSSTQIGLSYRLFF